MSKTAAFIVPPAPPVHPNDLPPADLFFGSLGDTLSIWSDYTFDTTFCRSRAFGFESVLINDPEGIRHIMASNSANYIRPTSLPRIMRPLLDRGLLFAEGGEWRRQRRLLSPSFTPSYIDILLPRFVAAANDLVCKLEGEVSVDLCEMYQETALKAVLDALFSRPDRIEELVRRYIIGGGPQRTSNGCATGEASFALGSDARHRFRDLWFSTVDKIVKERRNFSPGPGQRDLLDLLIAARDPETGDPLAPIEIGHQCATMIFAAYETTARLLFWASYLLTLDVGEQERLRSEVVAFPSERVRTLDDLGHWPRLRLVLLEALRLYPSVPFLVREPVADDVIMGQPVRRGVKVYISPWILHRHRRYWQNPAAFIPDRFAGQVAPWTLGAAYLPFGAGPHICIGAVFAMAEAQIILASILQHYTLIIEGERPVVPVGRRTIEPSYAPLFKFVKCT